MATASLPSELTDKRDKEECQLNINTLKHYNEIIPTLPKSKGWWYDHLYQYKGFWLSSEPAIKGLVILEDHHFVSKPDDIILASYPKSGTTWLRALIFATINRTSYDFATHPLLTSNPQDFVPILEGCVHLDPSVLENLPLPRLLSTHLPYSLFPDYITTARRFIYICRDPKDVLVSKWHFAQKLRSKQLPPFTLQDAFDMFCNGVSHFGPYWDHVLSYWRAPKKLVLFMKYEDMKREPLLHVKRLAEFLGKPFSMEEQNQGVVDEIIRLCSFEKMSDLEVNKSNCKSSNYHIKNSDFFRKGEVGDWNNYLTSEMATRIDQITEEKFRGTGLTFV